MEFEPAEGDALSIVIPEVEAAEELTVTHFAENEENKLVPEVLESAVSDGSEVSFFTESLSPFVGVIEGSDEGQMKAASGSDVVSVTGDLTGNYDSLAAAFSATDSGGTYTFTMNEDDVESGGDEFYIIQIGDGRTITIDLNGHSVRKGRISEYLFDVPSGTTFTIRDNVGDVLTTLPGTITSDVKTPATCTAKGTTTFTATFKNGSIAPDKKDVEDIEPLGHDYEITYEWTEDGKSCTAKRICKNDPTDVTMETVDFASGKITGAVKTPATCTDKGTTTYTATFENDLFEQQKHDVVDIEPLGHGWTITYEWADDGKSCTAKAECAHDHTHDVTETVDLASGKITSEEKEGATCTEWGTTTYTATFENALFEQQNHDVEDIEPLGHVWTDITYTWSEDGKSLTASAKCDRNHEYDVTKTVDVEGGKITSKVKTPATCTDKGTTTYTVTFENTAENEPFGGHTEETDRVDIPIQGHYFVNHKCTACDWMEEGYVTIAQSRDYVLLYNCNVDPYNSIKLELADGYKKLADRVSWSSDDVNIATVDEAGNVTAAGEGTTYINVMLNAYDEDYTARCCVDVSKYEPVTYVSKASLVNKKAATKLFSTDYARIEVLLEMEQLLNPKDAAGTAVTLENYGKYIKEASFANEAAAKMFDLRVIDDRNLELIPTEYAIANPKQVKSSYKSAIKVVIDGSGTFDGNDAEMLTGVLTLSVKKTTPKIKAAKLKFNPLNAGDTRAVVFSGAVVTDMAPAAALPEYLELDEGMNISLKNGAPAKASGKLKFNVKAAGWTSSAGGTYPVTVSYSVAGKTPKVTFAKKTLTLVRNTDGYVETYAKKATPVEFSDYTMNFVRVTEGKTVYANNAVLNCSESAGIHDPITVEWGPNAPADAVAHTYKVFYELAGKEYSFTVKSPKPAAPKLTLKATGAIENSLAGSYVSAAAKLTNVNKETTVAYDWSVTAKDGSSASALFVLTADGLNCTVRKAEGAVNPGTYYLTLKAKVGGTEVKATAPFIVKNTAEAKLKASVTLKKSGSIDVIRPGTAVRITPKFKNLYEYDITAASLEIGTKVNKVFTPNAGDLFDNTYENGVFTVKAKHGAGVDPRTKYFVRLNVGGVYSAVTALPVKMGKAKYVSDVKSVTLLFRDRYSTGEVNLSTKDSTLADIAEVSLVEKGAEKFDLTDLGHGKNAIGYKDSLIPAGQKANKSKTVKLYVFLEGNMTGKPNKTISVKVTIK